PAGDRHSLELLMVNAEGTENALVAAAEQGARFSLGSHSAVYGDSPEDLPDEDSALVMGETRLGGWSVGTSKLLAEQLCFAYHAEHGLEATVLRYGSAYGPYQPADSLIGRLVAAAIGGRAMPLPVDGARPAALAHVADLGAATLRAMEDPAATGEIFNVAGRETYATADLVGLVWELAGNAGPPRFEPQP